MAPRYFTSQSQTGCPLYASDFDLKDNRFVVVAGGGGESRSGVGNEIILLDTAKTQELHEASKIKLSPNEDSVTSLAYAKTDGQEGVLFAGVNSSLKEQMTGRNEHLRAFRIKYPSRKKRSVKHNAKSLADVEIIAQNKDKIVSDTEQEIPQSDAEIHLIRKTSLFNPVKTKKPEIFQRITRVSRPHTVDGSRMCLIASGLASEGQIALFSIDEDDMQPGGICGRLNLGGQNEAADADLHPFGESGDAVFRIAYCTDREVYVAEKTIKQEPSQRIKTTCLYGSNQQNTNPADVQTKFRSLRFLTPSLLIMTQNHVNGAGSELMLMDTTGQILCRHNLRKKIKSATGLSIATLPYRTLEQRPRDLIQSVVAVAGADQSISIFTVDHARSSPYQTSLRFYPFLFISNVHAASITSVSFSHFTSPKTMWSETPNQNLKLASTSIASTCVVHTFPLITYPPVQKQDRVPQYVLVTPTDFRKSLRSLLFNLFASLLVIAIGALFMQAFAEIRGVVPEVLGAKAFLSDSLHEMFAKPWLGDEIDRIMSDADHRANVINPAATTIIAPSISSLTA